MDELLDLLIKFMGEVETNLDSLSDEEAQEISEFLIETFANLQTPASQPQTSGESTTFTPPNAYPPGAELLWILSGRQIRPFVNYLLTYPGEGFHELASDDQALDRAITSLQQQLPSEPREEDEQGLDPTRYPSSNVEAMKYDPATKRLWVKFHGVNDQPVYQYEGVPDQIFKLLEHGNAFATTKGQNQWGQWWPMKNPSIGAALNQYIKAGGYPYQRLT
jgi:hypothetical protein